MLHSNLHTHTTFSDGKYTPEENVLAAIEKNMISLGFSDHSYTDFDLRYCMRPVNHSAYIREICRLKSKYENHLEIYLGLECDGHSELENRNFYDYVIGSCHYIKIDGHYFSVDHASDEQLNVIENYFNGDGLAYAKSYFDTYVKCTQCTNPDILGHFDLASKFGYINEQSSIYQKYALEALIASLEITPLIELNTGAISRKLRTVPYPAIFLLKEVLLHKGKIVLSSDSHDTAYLDFYFDEAIELLKSIGFKSIMQLQKNQFIEIAL